MRRLIVLISIGIAGCDGIEQLEVPPNYSDDQIRAIIWPMAIEHAESYGYLVDYAGEYNGLDDDGIPTDQIDVWFEDYNPALHDRQKPGGGRWWRN